MYTLQGLAIALALQGVNAFPSVLSERDHVVTSTKCKTSKLCDKKLDIPDSILKGGTSGAVKLSKDRNNCGLLCGPCKDFDAADQLVSTSGKYAYKPPTITQVRGPCPGLNAAANHNYLPRTGVPSITQTIFGLSKLYSMSFDLGGFLAAYAVALDGDIVTQTWSIGGPSPYQEQLSGVLGTPQGISYSHNKYEGDSSIGRCDAYINDGDAHSLSVQRFKYAYETGLDDDRYTLDKFSQAFTKNSERSVKTNKYFFAPLFSTTLVSPAAYNFVINFMSNHTAEEPAGYLNGAMFKEFFAIEGEYPNFKWLPGQERVPNNWYRRPRNNPYTAAKGVFGDLIAEFLAYPNSFKFGGNTGTTDSYVGIDIANFTNGVYNAETLFKGDNFACFLFQEQQQAIPDFLKGKTAAAQLALKALTKLFGKLDCPQTSKFNDNVYGQYPGYSYSPKPGKGVPTTC